MAKQQQRYRKSVDKDAAMYKTEQERAGQGRGSQYGYQMSQRPAPSTVRTISNASPIPQHGQGLPPTRPDYAGRQFSGTTGTPGLPAEKEMELKQNGFADMGSVRYILEPSTGRVTQMPRPGSRGEAISRDDMNRMKRD